MPVVYGLHQSSLAAAGRDDDINSLAKTTTQTMMLPIVHGLH